jgi:hypothetical protein
MGRVAGLIPDGSGCKSLEGRCPLATCMARQLKLTGAWFLFDLYSLLIKFKHWSIRSISPKKRKTMSHDVSLSTTKSIQFTVCDSFDCPYQLKTVGSPRWRSFQNEPFEKTPNNWARITLLMPPTYPHSDLNHNHLFQLIHILLVSAY